MLRVQHSQISWPAGPRPGTPTLPGEGSTTVDRHGAWTVGLSSRLKLSSGGRTAGKNANLNAWKGGCDLKPLSPGTRTQRAEISKSHGVLAGHVLITRCPISRLTTAERPGQPQREEEWPSG